MPNCAVNTELSTSMPGQPLPSDLQAAKPVETAKDALGDWHRYLVGAWVLGVFLWGK